MIESCSRFWRAAKSRLSLRRIDVTVVADRALISSSAVSLSASALHSALMLHFEEKGIMSREDRRAVYERALELLKSDPADGAGVAERACEIIEQKLQPERLSNH